MRLSRHELYKDSEIEWLGEIPNHWEIKRIKSIFNLERGKFTHRPRNDFRMYEGGIYPFIQTGDVARASKYILKFKQTLNAKGIKVSKKFKKGTLAMTIAANIGDVAILGFDAYFPDSIIAFRTKQNVDYYYYLLSVTKSELNTVKVTNTQDNLNLERLNSLLKVVPPINEQIIIANFLDQKISSIDKKISSLETKILTYTELIKSLNNEIIFYGLNNIPLKKSNIDWIGNIPENWSIARGKDIFKEKSKKGHPNEPLLAASQKQGVVLKTMLPSKSMEAQKDFENFKLVEINDFVISLRSFEGGIETAYYKGIISPVYSVFSAKGNLHVSYFKHLFKSSMFISNLKTMVTGIRDGQSIKFVEIQNTFFPLPPLDEQVAIAKYLDEKISKIEIIIGNITEQIKRLKEFRKSLINDVVTGKLKVTE